MAYIQDNRIDQCLNDIQKYEEWGKQLTGQCIAQFSGANTPASLSVLHYGLEFFKAKMKLSVLQDNQHSDKEKENRLKQIDIEIHQTEEIMKHDLEYRGLLMHP
jgi:hypothetical protein